MTPAQLNLYARAFTQRRQEEQKLTQANIYSLAALIRPMVWGKHPPSFEKAFPGTKQKPKEMTDEEMYAQIKRLNALFGGEEVD